MNFEDFPAADLRDDSFEERCRIGIEDEVVEVTIRSSNAGQRRLAPAVHRQRFARVVGVSKLIEGRCVSRQDPLKLIGEHGVVLLALLVDDLGRHDSERSIVALLVGDEQPF